MTVFPTLPASEGAPSFVNVAFESISRNVQLGIYCTGTYMHL